MHRFVTLLLSATALATPALAQEGGARPANGGAMPQQMDEEGGSIVVNGQRPEGSVIGDIAPEVTFNAGDIRSFGVSSLNELIAELAAQTASGQGRGGESPVVLLGGKRVSSFAEIRDIPTEAIQRVEILPEEVALKYGYRPTQKVVNVVLRRRFKAFTGELEAAAPTEGGQFSPEIDTSFLRIGDFGRLNLALKYERSSALYESERDLIPQPARQPYDLLGNVVTADGTAGVLTSAANGISTLADFGAENATDTTPYRTLLPQTDALTFNAVFAKTIFDNVSASFNGTLTYNASNSAQGLAGNAIDIPAASAYNPFGQDATLYRYLGEFGALGQETSSITGHLGTTLSGMAGSWLWTFTGTYDHSVSRTSTDRGFTLTEFQADIDGLDPLLNPYAALTRDQLSGVRIDRARSISDVANAELLFSGKLFDLPAGAVSTSIKIGGSMTDQRSRSVRSDIVALANLSRDTANGQISFDVPIASRKKGFLAPLGELSANFNFGYDQLSDFGGLKTIGAGLTWTPVKALNLVASYSEDEGAPSIGQLGNPIIATTGVRIFDYVRGETVDITRVTGGNDTLSADNRRVFKLGATLKPLTGTDLGLTVNYTNSRVRDPIASFPSPTAAIEAAFPDRFTRDEEGRLVRIDASSINYARQDQEEIRWGINFSKQLWTPPRPAGGPGGPGGQRPGQDRQGQQGQQAQGEQPNLRDLLPSGQTPGQGQSERSNSGERQSSGERGGPGGPGGPGGFGGPPGGGAPGGFRGPGGRGTRLQLAVYHTIHLKEQILVYEGGPVLDLLRGDATGSSGGQPRHEVQVQAGLTHNGFGGRLSAGWQSGTTVNGGVDGSDRLRFSSLATLNLRLFANLGQQQALTAKWPFLRGSRLSLSVTNLFNTRQEVRDANGDTPISYQPAYLDPLGRSVRISFRKLFF